MSCKRMTCIFITFCYCDKTLGLRQKQMEELICHDSFKEIRVYHGGKTWQTAANLASGGGI